MALIRPGCCGLCGQPIVGRIENYKCMACGRAVHDECAQSADKTIRDGRCGICGAGGAEDGSIRPESQPSPPAAAAAPVPAVAPPPVEPPRAAVAAMVAERVVAPEPPPTPLAPQFSAPTVETRPATPTFAEPATFESSERPRSSSLTADEKQEDMRTLGRNLLVVGAVMAFLGAGKWISIAASASADAPPPPAAVPIMLLVVGAGAALFGGLLRKRAQPS